jgi:hypothetical protein
MVQVLRNFIFTACQIIAWKFTVIQIYDSSLDICRESKSIDLVSSDAMHNVFIVHVFNTTKFRKVFIVLKYFLCMFGYNK